MKNYLQPGDVIEYAHSIAVTSGQPVAIGGIVGVASGDFAAGESGSYHTRGVFTLPKQTTSVVAVGDVLRFDESNFIFAKGGTSATGDINNAGTAINASANGVGTVDILINVAGNVQ